MAVFFGSSTRRSFVKGKKGICAVFFLVFSLSSAAFGASLSKEEALYRSAERVLNGHTAFSWGKDCIVWMVAYPEALVEPWVALKAEEEGLSEEAARSYRASFRQELQMDETQPVLVTVYVFGENPLDLSPFSEHIVLVDSSLKEIEPLSSAPALEEPLEGIVQGFVFFPLQKGPFSLKLSGIAPGAPRKFAFPGMKPVEKAMETEEEVLVVRLPKKETPPQSSEEEVFSGPLSPTPTVAPPKKSLSPVVPEEDPAQPPAYLVLPQKPLSPLSPTPAMPSPISSSKKDLQPSEKEPIPSIFSEGDTEERENPVESVPFPIDRTRRVEAFLEAWKAGDVKTMYSMISQESRQRLSQKDFARSAQEDPFRFALKNSHTLTWEGENLVKVVAPQKMLVVRVLKSKTLRLVLEGGAWYIAW